ncbi:family 20 glycosylhydrolase [Agromyces laixinhei]|uniref:family 20 glycosylhydrolase n=1 Tax=Agromyces laixinhei TaxID=2585717 RepID=UPI0018DB43AE|nr:family 20 glycosylhydrolase [Agromyces laixinhei]
MTGIVPAPAQIELRPAAAPFRFSEGAHIVAPGTAKRIGALLAAELLAATGREVPVFETAPVSPVDRSAGISLLLRPLDEASEEAYTLDVSDQGAVVTASTPAGLYRGTRSLRQLLPVPASRVDAPSAAWTVPAVTVRDAPRFAYRGVMLDVVRHFFSVDEVLRLIDAVAMLKVNHFHLHLTDDQGWRIQIDSWPELTGIGASTAVGGAPGGFYTKADFVRIVEYAAERFITVVPEIDLPGHTCAALSAYPELNHDGIARTPYEGVEVGFSSLSAAPERAEATDRFLADVMREVAEITPGPWLHIGGDESWATPEADYLDLVRRITAAAASTGKTVIGWHEIGASGALPTGTVAQYWSYLVPQEHAGVLTASVVEQGGRVIMSPADTAYLDIQYPGAPATPHGYALGLDWADGPTSLEAAYSWEPAGIVPGVGEDAILGVEAPLWTETVLTIDDVEFMVFPRLAAVAEIGWSAAPGDGTRDYADFAARVAGLHAHWDAAGTRYCTAELDAAG